jgi:hypothetical protein
MPLQRNEAHNENVPERKGKPAVTLYLIALGLPFRSLPDFRSFVELSTPKSS